MGSTSWMMRACWVGISNPRSLGSAEASRALRSRAEPRLNCNLQSHEPHTGSYIVMMQRAGWLHSSA